MHIVVLGSNILKEELLSSAHNNIQVEWINDINDFKTHSEADAFIDLEFELDSARVEILKSLLPKPVIVNSVIKTISEINLPLVRINAWPTFLQRKIMEASCNDPERRIITEEVFFALQKKIKWIPDIPGFISSRVVVMIINEAYFALGDNVSTKEEIDIAMKLGANYLYGPFEWKEKIGLKNIYELLNELSKMNIRYKAAPQLKVEALNYVADFKH